MGSLAQAFRSAGAQTVIATQWAVVDDTARQFAVHFYEAACKTAVPPSQALTYAKEKIRQESPYKHWAFWSAFICIGVDLPLFFIKTNIRECCILIRCVCVLVTVQ